MNPTPSNLRLLRSLFPWLSLLPVLLLTATAPAHTTGETYVWLNVEEDRFTGRVEVNLDDLREKLGIGVPPAAETSQPDPEADAMPIDNRLAVLQQTRQRVLDYIRQHYEIWIDSEPIPIEYIDLRILDLPDGEGSYAQYIYQTPVGPVPDTITIRNSLFVDDDFTHRSLVCIERNQKSGQAFEGEFAAMVFGSHNPVQELDLTHIDLLLRPRDFVWQGVLHIWIGIDHILFIVALLLPAVLVRRDGKWHPVPKFRQAFWNIVKIVTLFTIAHSITLSLAALGVIHLPSRWVESLIALSIVLVAINTIRPKFNVKTGFIIFGFGLFHGMGFASVMSELPFRMIYLVKVLIGFNVGVELGQLAIVAVVFPIIFLLRTQKYYQSVVLVGGSAVIGLIASYWFIERALAL
ncbi:HupE/UreJ family protein [Stieleria sp. ICT_E10.1]|uniref:HupE/UreJ family protein n=1 Tax=Stieleria sedimenti TaxID=2976331 RepID=UPI00217F772B|nr:HupE/UreJ family protein [Stieleria sedimenti]MCS7467132.1 HupE/UreJ family protein [Stieleria sedimenti]